MRNPQPAKQNLAFANLVGVAKISPGGGRTAAPRARATVRSHFGSSGLLDRSSFLSEGEGYAPASGQPGLPEMKETMEKDLGDLTSPFEILKFEELVAAENKWVKANIEAKAAGLLSPFLPEGERYAPAGGQITGILKRGDILRRAAEFTGKDFGDLKKKIRAISEAIEAETAGQYLLWSCRSLHLTPEQIEKLTTEQIAGELQAGQQVAGELQSQAELIEKLTTEPTTEQIAGELQSQAELIEKLTTEPTPEQIAGELQAGQQVAGELQAGQQVADDLTEEQFARELQALRQHAKKLTEQIAGELQTRHPATEQFAGEHF